MRKGREVGCPTPPRSPAISSPICSSSTTWASGASRRSRGLDLAEFNSEADAQSAIADLDGKDLDGRALKVNEAQERQPRGGGGRW